MKFKMPEKPNISRRAVTVLLFALTLPILLASFIFGMFFLCRVGDFKIVGEIAHYSEEELIEATGIKAGERLYFIDSAGAESALKENFPRIKSVKVSPSWFTSVKITVEEESPKYYSEVNGDYYLLNEDFRVIDMSKSFGEFKDEAIMLSFQTSGAYTFKEAVLGERVVFVSEKAEKKMSDFIEEIESFDFGDFGVSALGFRDGGTQFDAYIVLDGRLRIILGNTTDIPEKIRKSLQRLAEQDADFEFGEIIVYDINEISFRKIDSIE